MTKEDRHRVIAIIEDVEGPYVEDHGILTTNITVKAGYGYHQGFGGLCLGEKKYADDYVATLCKAFGVKKLKELIGKKCFLLYSFGDLNEPIEGLESIDTGKRFLHNEWRKKHWPETKSTFKQEVERIESTISWTKRRMMEAQKRLTTLKSKYKDWSKQR